MGMFRRRSRRSRGLAVALVLLLDVAVLGTDGYLLTHRSTTTAVDLQSALVTFRASSAGDGAGASAPAASHGAVPTSAPASPTAGASAPAAAVPGSAAPVAPASPASSGGSSTTAAAPVAPPVAGVYAYRTSGGESISILAAHHDYPAETYASVRHTGGCGWQIHAAVVQEHVDERNMCSGGDAASQLSQTRNVTFFGTTDGGTFTCAPPAVQEATTDVAGSRTQADCGDGKGSSARLVRTTLGRGTADVDGVTVAVVRIRIDGTITGRIRGTSMDLLTLVASTGLPVRWQRSVDTLADAFGGTVRYQEQAQFDLVALVPET